MNFYKEQKLLAKKEVNLKLLAENLIKLLTQAVRDGFSWRYASRKSFVDTEGNIIPVDFGIMGRLDKNNRKIFS